MRIGISTSVIQRGKTGIAQYLLSLLRALKNTAGEHQFVLFVLEEDRPLFHFVEDRMKIVTVEEKYRPPVKNILWHQTVLPRLVSSHQLDVLHIPSYRRLLWPKPCPLVATIHDLAPFHVVGKYDLSRMLYGRIVVKQLSHRQDKIIAISESTAQDIVKYFHIPCPEISIIHNGIDHDQFFPAPKDAAKQHIGQRYGIHAPFFLYIARLEHPAKNHVRLIHAFEHFKNETKSNWKLVFGGSDWHGANVIHQAIRQSSHAGDIRSLGFVPNEDVPVLYRAAEAFVCPSLYEGFGLPPVEAMACGCPVISSGRGALGEVLGSAAVIIDPENIGNMQAQLVKLFRDQEFQKKLSQAGIVQAQNFNWQKTAAATLNIYLQAAKHPKSAAISPRTHALSINDVAIPGSHPNSGSR